MGEKAFEELDHTADWALRIRGGSLPELLINAARGMLSLMGAEPAQGPARKATLRVHAEDPESLLVSWLEELLFLMESQRVTLGEMHLAETGELHVEAEVELLPLAKMDKEIKAVTYHGLQVRQTPNGLEAEIVFDV